MYMYVISINPPKLVMRNYSIYGPYVYFRPCAYGPDRMGKYVYGPTVRVWSGFSVQYKQVILLMLANGANTEDEHNIYCSK